MRIETWIDSETIQGTVFTFLAPPAVYDVRLISSRSNAASPIWRILTGHGLTVNGVARQFAVNLTDPQESDLTPRALGAAGPAPVEAPAGDALATRALWPWLAAAALVLLLLEWGVWCARRPHP